MSGYILCQVPRTQKPYYIQNISTNVYSIEELCYYFYHNLHLLDDTVLNEELCIWLRDCLGLLPLYKKVSGALQNQGEEKIRDFVLPVFKEINYLTYEELKEYQMQLEKLADETPAGRQKRKADCLAENGMFVNAIQVYKKILEQYSEEDARFLGTIYHNTGCAYSHLFQKEEAIDCFWKAYEKLHTKLSLKTYLYAFYNARSNQEYEDELTKLGVDPQTRKELQQEILKAWEQKPIEVNAETADEMLERLIKEYHRSTGA